MIKPLSVHHQTFISKMILFNHEDTDVPLLSQITKMLKIDQNLIF